MRFWLTIFLLLGAFSAHAQDLAAVAAGVDQRKAQLETLGAAIDAPDADLLATREALRTLRRNAQEASAPARAQLAIVRADLDRLGPPPGETDPPEAASIIAERERLNREVASLDAAVRQSDLNMAEADRLIAEIARLRRAQFSTAVLSRGPSGLSPGLWGDAIRSARLLTGRVSQAASAWRAEQSATGAMRRASIAIAAAILIALALFIPIRLGADRSIRKRIGDLEPKASRKVMVAAARAAVRVIPGFIGGLIVYEALRRYGVITPATETLARWIWLFVIAVFLVDGCVVAVFAPQHPKWRIVQLENWQVLSIRTLAFLATIILGLATVAIEAAKTFGDAQSLILAVEAGEATALAAILYVLSRGTLWRSKTALMEKDPGATSDKPKKLSPFWPRVRLLARLIVVATIVAVLTGYIAFGHYLTTKTYYLIGLAAVIWLVRSLLREGVRIFDRNFTSDQDKTGGEHVLYFWIGLFIDAVAMLVFVPPALLVLGAEWADVRAWVSDAFFGFRIGAFEISIARIASAVALFLLLLYATRTVQRTTEERIFPQSRIDVGVQNSLKTLIGYLGLIVAFTASVGVLGFDLSNLAIIAGALSVGIGFGLQSIVNNFVSGLILLFERPIKVGDWIVTQSGEGFVKRISVRSTEIETFDRASVIVPNSELISSAVVNWTHKDKIGRVIVPIGVSYDSDPERVAALLKEVADEHPAILSYPEPFIYFGDFADSALNFELRGFIRDIGSGLGVRSQLRMAIFKKLKEAGVEIPFPQRDLHIKTGAVADATATLTSQA
ncbi:MAG: DUF3772 domain-containing protein [Pseudomonadota bacterium]